jgi:hypothetical protein
MATLDITADTQAYDPLRQVITAQGNVRLQLNDAFLEADRIWVNLLNRYAVAEGNVLITRGAQIVRGERVEYNLTQASGVMFNARGEIFLPSIGTDIASPIDGPPTSHSVYDPLNPDQPITNVIGAGGFQASTTTAVDLINQPGGLQQLRFEADRLTFDPETWQAEGVRLTNDPYSPPDIEFRADQMQLVSLSPEQDRLTLTRPRAVFDQGFSVPLLRSRLLFNRGAVDAESLNPIPTGIGIDDLDRGGLFVERSIPIIESARLSFGLTPQYLVTRALNDGILSPQAFGLGAELAAVVGPRTTVQASGNLSSFELSDFENNLRSSLRAQQLIGNHSLALEASYRDRLYNGSLGFQNVQSSIGAVFLSPVVVLNRSGLQLTYQASSQFVTAETDRADLLGPAPKNNLISLGRFQVAANLRQGLPLWQGKALPPTPTEGLRYTPQPIVPQISLGLGLLGVATYYTSQEYQNSIAGDIRIDAQFGHLSRTYLDYTRFNLGYYRAFVGGQESPFLFDRDVDQNVLSFGLTQQVYGPLLLGFQTSLNLDSGSDVNTDFIIEYSRRAYGVLLRYSPTQGVGFLGFRLSNFNWLGNSNPFDNPRIQTVTGGVVNGGLVSP